jgi:hypothetical protein
MDIPGYNRDSSHEVQGSHISRTFGLLDLLYILAKLGLIKAERKSKSRSKILISAGETTPGLQSLSILIFNAAKKAYEQPGSHKEGCQFAIL